MASKKVCKLPKPRKISGKKFNPVKKGNKSFLTKTEANALKKKLKADGYRVSTQEYKGCGMVVRKGPKMKTRRKRK